MRTSKFVIRPSNGLLTPFSHNLGGARAKSSFPTPLRSTLSIRRTKSQISANVFQTLSFRSFSNTKTSADSYTIDVTQNIQYNRPFGKSISDAPNHITEELFQKLPKVEQHVDTIYPKLEEDFVLQSGATLPKEAIHIKYATFGTPEINKPILLLCPSMSNSVFAMNQAPHVDPVTKQPVPSEKLHVGWWNKVIGKGTNFGIDVNKFFVVCGAPLGSPFGSTSPLTVDPGSSTGDIFGPNFPQITPKDQAKLQSLLLKSLGIDKVYAVVGGSMGGMQSIQFAANYPEMYDLFVSIASTAQTSPGIVALRSVQRAAVRMDPEYQQGYYYKNNKTRCSDIDVDDDYKSPVNGMRVARMFGTICYRSHDEFVERFSWYPNKITNTFKDSETTSFKQGTIGNDNLSFEVERYLSHQADIFIKRAKYDANCYLLNSKSMDLMDIGGGKLTFEEGVKKIPPHKQALLISYKTDKLTPPEDLERLSRYLGKNGVRVHYEVLESQYGHDAFLIDREAPELNMRLKAFLEGRRGSEVHGVQKLVKELLSY